MTNSADIKKVFECLQMKIYFINFSIIDTTVYMNKLSERIMTSLEIKVAIHTGKWLNSIGIEG